MILCAEHPNQSHRLTTVILKMNDDNNNKRTYVEEDDSSVKFLAQRLLLYHYFTHHPKDCIRNKNKTFVINSVICFLLSLSATFPKL